MRTLKQINQQFLQLRQPYKRLAEASGLHVSTVCRALETEVARPGTIAMLDKGLNKLLGKVKG